MTRARALVCLVLPINYMDEKDIKTSRLGYRVYMVFISSINANESLFYDFFEYLYVDIL